MKLTDTLYGIILNEYNDAMMRRLIAKFKEEQPNLNDDTIIKYIIDFKKIASKLENRDILTYKWKDLETAVDANRSVRVKAGKIDVTAEDANLIYNEGGVRIYHGNGKKACIKYSNGYSFCIGARGKDNMYSYYRYNPDDFGPSVGTPYFVFNDNLDKKYNPEHILVIFQFTHMENKETFFTVTNGDNDGDKEFDTFASIVSKYPWVRPLQDKMLPSELTNDEQSYHKEKLELEKEISDGKKVFRNHMNTVTNEVNIDFYVKLYELLFNRLDYLDTSESIESKYNDMKEGGHRYICDIDISKLNYEDLHSILTPALRAAILHIEDWFSRAVILATESSFDMKVKAYVKKLIMPQLKRSYEEESYVDNEHFIKNYDMIFNAVVNSMKDTAQKSYDLSQVRAVTLHGKMPEIIEMIIASERKLNNLKRKYQDIA